LQSGGSRFRSDLAITVAKFGGNEALARMHGPLDAGRFIRLNPEGRQDN